MISSSSGRSFVRNFDPRCETNEVVGVRRFEVITGAGGRRAWSAENKARIVAETLAAGANVSAVARRYGLLPQQIYTWRRLAREGVLALPAEGEIGFVPIVAGGETRPSLAAPARAGMIEIEIAGAAIRVGPGVDCRLLREVLQAVKAVR
jgi:transposase